MSKDTHTYYTHYAVPTLHNWCSSSIYYTDYYTHYTGVFLGSKWAL